jgi:hypothetical protein
MLHCRLEAEWNSETAMRKEEHAKRLAGLLSDLEQVKLLAADMLY